MESHIRNRHRLRKKVIRELSQKLSATFSSPINFETSIVDSAILDKQELLIINNEILVIIFDIEPFLTIRGILKYQPTGRYVTVDMGAVAFISKGADVMAPGIVDADENIQPGDLVWVRDKKNQQPLAIGRGLISGPKMVQSTKDKAIKSLHYVGDKLWNIRIHS